MSERGKENLSVRPPLTVIIGGHDSQGLKLAKDTYQAGNNVAVLDAQDEPNITTEALSGYHLDPKDRHHIRFFQTEIKPEEIRQALVAVEGHFGQEVISVINCTDVDIAIEGIEITRPQDSNN